MASLKVSYQTGSQNIEGETIINAPLASVFAAYRDQELFSQWWARGNKLKIIEFDFKDTGYWHVAELADDGNEYEFCGIFHNVVNNKLIIQTFEFLGWAERGHVLLEKLEFIAVDDHTTLIKTISTGQSPEDSRMMIESGMEEGWRQSVEALGRLVELKQ